MDRDDTFRQGWSGVARRAAIAAAALAALVTAGGGQARASAGCDAVNAGGFDLTATSTFTTHAFASAIINGFVAGDRLTFTIMSEPGALSTWSLTGSGGTLDQANYFPATPQMDVRSYTVTGNQDTELGEIITRIAGITLIPGTISVTATCTPASASSANLGALQAGVTKLVAETSGAAITGATGNALDAAFNGGNPVTLGPNGISLAFTAEPRSAAAHRSGEALAALGYVDPAADRMLLAPTPASLWTVWAELRDTGWNRSATGLDGNQINLTAGIGRKLTPDLVVGVLAGFEHFKYDVASLPGTMNGSGGTVGGYAGWRIAPELTWDATLAWSRVAYDGTAGAATGAFTGSRLLASTGLSGRHRWSGFVLEPSARLHALWESEDAYTDSLATLHPARSFSVGRASVGSKATYPLMSGDLTVKPYAGLYGDWRFSTDTAVPAGQPDVWIGDGLSARLTGGVTVATPGGATLGLGGEIGGLGAGHTMWSVTGRVFAPF